MSPISNSEKEEELLMYRKEHHLPEIYEAILAGLAIMTPDDPLGFILDKLKHIQEVGYDYLEWDMFIYPPLKRRRIMLRSYLDMIFNLEDEYEPSIQQYQKACRYYNKVHTHAAFRALIQYHLHKRNSKAIKKKKEERAYQHWRVRMLKEVFDRWNEWIDFRKGRQGVAYGIIQNCYNIMVGRIFFEAWHQITLEAKKTREYFERLERGDQMADEDGGHESGEARDDISHLPKVVAQQIFGYLDVSDLIRCAGVCRQWKVMSQASHLWNKLNLSSVRTMLTDKPAVRILQRTRPYLIQLNLRLCNQITDVSFKAVRECRNLQDLNLSECSPLTDNNLRTVVEGCRILLYLNVSFNNISDASMRYVSKCLENLQCLSIASCNYLTDKGLQYLSYGKCAKGMSYLDISANNQFTVEGYKYLSRCTKLQTLIAQSLFTLDDKAITVMASGCRTLQYVSLLGSNKVTEEGLKKLASSRTLKKLKISGNYYVTDSVFKLTVRNQSAYADLRHLYLTDCVNITDACLRALSVCKHLAVLNLADCVRISDAGIRSLVEGSCGAKLKELNLSNCLRVGDLAVVSLHKRCPGMTYLSLCYLEHITESGIEILGNFHHLVGLDITGCQCGDQELALLGNNKKLRYLSLSECILISDLGLQKFAQQASNIERLDLSFLPLISDAAIKSLAFSCRVVTWLNLAGCKQLTDLSVQYLSGVCAHLLNLDISGSLHITDKSLKYLRKGCSKLQYLNLSYCQQVSRAAFAAMMKSIAVIEFETGPPPPHYGYDAQGKSEKPPEKRQIEHEKRKEQLGQNTGDRSNSINQGPTSSERSNSISQGPRKSIKPV